MRRGRKNIKMHKLCMRCINSKYAFLISHNKFSAYISARVTYSVLVHEVYRKSFIKLCFHLPLIFFTHGVILYTFQRGKFIQRVFLFRFVIYKHNLWLNIYIIVVNRAHLAFSSTSFAYDWK